MIDNYERIQQALRELFQTVKKPHGWQQVKVSANTELDRPAAIVLLMVYKHPQRISDLASKLSIEAPSVTRITQALEQAGYITRTQDPKDKRGTVISITISGKESARRIRKAQLAVLRQALADWSDDDLDTFADLFLRFSASLASHHNQ